MRKSAILLALASILAFEFVWILDRVAAANPSFLLAANQAPYPLNPYEIYSIRAQVFAILAVASIILGLQSRVEFSLPSRKPRHRARITQTLLLHWIGFGSALLVGRFIDFEFFAKLHLERISSFRFWFDFAPHSSHLSFIFRGAMLLGFFLSSMSLLRLFCVLPSALSLRNRAIVGATTVIADPGLHWIPSRLLWPIFKKSMHSMIAYSLSFFYPTQTIISEIRESDGLPLLGTTRFFVNISGPCSGLEGISFFIVCAVVLLYLDRARLKYFRTIQFILAGMVLMLMSNVLRILGLIVIGHHYGAPFAMRVWHEYAGALIYAVTISLYFVVVYPKILKNNESGETHENRDSN